MIEDTKKHLVLLSATSTKSSSSTSLDSQDIEINLTNLEAVELSELEGQKIDTEIDAFEADDSSDNSLPIPPTNHIQPLWRWPWGRKPKPGGRP